MFQKIDLLLEKIKTYPPLSPASQERIMEDFMMRFTYNSNAIEGSTLTEQDTYIVLKDDITISGKPLRYHLDAIGHRDAFLLVQELAANGTALTEDVVKRIHTHVLMRSTEDAGQYRSVDVYITGTDVILPSAQQVAAAMQRLMKRYNEEMRNWHAVQRAAVFHLFFESIHPFVDGNGRTGRLLVNLELMKAGIPPIDIKVTDKARYYAALRSYQGADELELPMIYLVSEYVESALHEAITQLERAQSIRKERERDGRS